MPGATTTVSTPVWPAVSLTVTVWVPAVLSVIGYCGLDESNAPATGRSACGSLLVKVRMSPSPAVTVAWKVMPAVAAPGPVMPQVFWMPRSQVTVPTLPAAGCELVGDGLQTCTSEPMAAKRSEAAE